MENENKQIEIDFESDNEIIEVILIKKGSINHLNWMDKDYVEKLLKLDLYENIIITKDNFYNIIGSKLELEKYDNKIGIKTEFITDEYNSNCLNKDKYSSNVYEIMYIDFVNNSEYIIDDNFNELGSLFNINGEKIYSNVIIFKSILPSLTDSSMLTTLHKNDLYNILYNKVHTKVVLWDDEKWYEEKIAGDLNLFAKKFFDDDDYQKKEISFLMHNISIWFTSDYGNKDICGKLISKPIEKCIIFTMKSQEYRGCITLEEVKKIIYLSNKLVDYNTPIDMVEEKYDRNNRKIINNKFKILDRIYNDNI